MIIDTRKLNAQRKYSGTVEFEYNAPENLIDIPFVKYEGPVKIVAEYDLFEDMSLELRGKVIYRLVGQCSRCLKDAFADVEGELDAYFQPFEKGEDYSYSGGIIRLEDAVNDAIMASMPRVMSCGDDCEEIRYQ